MYTASIKMMRSLVGDNMTVQAMCKSRIRFYNDERRPQVVVDYHSPEPCCENDTYWSREKQHLSVHIN